MSSEDSPLYPLSHYVSKMTRGQRLCRSRGRHDFPSSHLGIDDVIPGRMRADRDPHDNSYTVVEYCNDCGKEVRWQTLPGGLYDRFAPKKYVKYEDEIRVPQEVNASPSDIRETLMGNIIAQRFGPKAKMRKPVQRKDRTA